MKKKTEFRLFGIFGFPLSHTLSPAMQEAAFEQLGIKAYYLPFEFSQDEFKKAMRGLLSFALEGFNLTVPHKETVITFLDRLTPEAKAIGAVNTVFQKKGKWIGANTDVSGFLNALQKEGRFDPHGKKVLILGAGGAARAVIYGLASKGVRRLVIINRHESRAKKIIRDFKRLFPRVLFQTLSWTKGNLKEAFEDCNLVVNATSVGLKAKEPALISGSLLPKASATKQILFVDLIYDPSRTAFLKTAQKKGHRILSGLGMLLFQGAKALEYWTGRKAPVSAMRETLQKALAERHANKKRS